MCPQIELNTIYPTMLMRIFNRPLDGCNNLLFLVLNQWQICRIWWMLEVMLLNWMSTRKSKLLQPSRGWLKILINIVGYMVFSSIFLHCWALKDERTYFCASQATPKIWTLNCQYASSIDVSSNWTKHHISHNVNENLQPSSRRL